jgi:hypothetical protein
MCINFEISLFNSKIKKIGQVEIPYREVTIGNYLSNGTSWIKCFNNFMLVTLYTDWKVWGGATYLEISFVMVVFSTAYYVCEYINSIQFKIGIQTYFFIYKLY